VRRREGEGMEHSPVAALEGKICRPLDNLRRVVFLSGPCAHGKLEM
jgi:hypothetical protein